MLKPGIYHTRGGLRAIVARLCQCGKEWVWEGAIESADGALVMNAWRPSGKQWGCDAPDLDLILGAS
jgi:hypothetical protein